jgi:replicative DNA helicase
MKNKNDTPQMEIDIENSIKNISNLHLYITDSSTLTPRDIYAKCEKLVANKGAKIIFIDYLQLIDLKGEKNKQRYELVGQLSRELKMLSTKLDIPIVALAQLNRESESADKVSKMGKVSQLRESGSIEQDMDMGIVIDRPFKRGQTTKDDGSSTDCQAFISIQKHRNGEEKEIEIEYNPKTMRFTDLANNYNTNTPFIVENPQIKREITTAPIIGIDF